MSFKKVLGLVSISALVAAASGFGCTVSSTATPDAGTVSGDDGGSGTKTDGGHVTTDGGGSGDDGSTGGSCAPGDVTGFTATWTAPNAHTDSCTQAQIDAFWTDCLDNSSTSTSCAPFGGTGASTENKACAACLISSSTDANYGAIIQLSGVAQLNLAGCIAIAEGHIDGTGCGGKLQTLDQCQSAACDANCPVTDDASFADYNACQSAAQQSSTLCGSYVADANCVDALAEANAEVAACIAFTDFQTGYNAIAPIFCLNAGDGG